MKVKFFSVIFALLCFIIAGCGGDGSNAENGGDGSVKEQGTTLTENDFEFWQDNKDYPIVMKKAKEGIAAVIHSAQKDKDGVFAIDVVGFRTANGESTWEDKWYFKKSGDKLQYSSHQKSFGQKWADVTDSDEAQQKAFIVASASAKSQNESVIYTPNKETKKQETEVARDNQVSNEKSDKQKNNSEGKMKKQSVSKSDAEKVAIETLRRTLGDLTLFDKEFVDSDKYGRALFLLTGKSEAVGNGKAKIKYAVIVWNVEGGTFSDYKWTTSRSRPFIKVQSTNDGSIEGYKSYVHWGKDQGLGDDEKNWLIKYK